MSMDHISPHIILYSPLYKRFKDFKWDTIRIVHNWMNRITPNSPNPPSPPRSPQVSVRPRISRPSPDTSASRPCYVSSSSPHPTPFRSTPHQHTFPPDTAVSPCRKNNYEK
mmetsp:Transcript_29281/g.46738  ORF Transcript_29281/g.46738 Transcript_29281/m.46738 type:complete len:111 (-) Transcript_29281:32-364(-)